MRALSLFTAAAAASALTLGAVGVSAQTVTESTGLPYKATDVTESATTGQLMGGMQILGTASNGDIFSGTWNLLRGTTWGVSNDLFEITIDAETDTFLDPWNLTVLGTTTLGLSSLTFRGAGGNTVFDRAKDVDGDEKVTEKTARGKDFKFEDGDSWSTSVEYTNAVGVRGNAPLGDIYERVDVSFETAIAGGTEAGFLMDTDNAIASGVFVPVPEPASMALLLSGVLGLGAAGIGRRRNRV